MIGPWIDSPLFMGLLEDNYIYEIKEKKGKKERCQDQEYAQHAIRNST